MTPRVREILNWYSSENLGVVTNLARILNHGALKGSGKLQFLSSGSSVQEGPAICFGPNPDAFDPSYHFELSIESKVSAMVAPLGTLLTVGRDYVGEIPTLMEIDQYRDNLDSEGLTSQALQLGCVGIQVTYNIDSQNGKLIQNPSLMSLLLLARNRGLVVLGKLNQNFNYKNQSNESESPQIVPLKDTIPDSNPPISQSGHELYFSAIHQMVQMGVHIIATSVPPLYTESQKSLEYYKLQGIKAHKLPERVRHTLHCAFNGKRILVFTEESFKTKEDLFIEVSDLARGGAFGSYLEKNSFQRIKKDAVPFLQDVMECFAGRNF